MPENLAAGAHTIAIEWENKMPEIFDVAINVAAKSGPELRATWKVSPGSYEKLKLEMNKKGNADPLKIVSAKQIKVLAIAVGACEGTVTYTVKEIGAEAALSTVSLESHELPQIVLYRAGMLPTDKDFSLNFANPGDTPLTVDVLVGRTLS